METQAFLYSTCTPSPLSCITFGDEGLNRMTNLSFFVKSNVTMFARINTTGDIGNGYSSFGNICRKEINKVWLLQNNAKAYR
jgi:hypothetical protein